MAARGPRQLKVIVPVPSMACVFIEWSQNLPRITHIRLDRLASTGTRSSCPITIAFYISDAIACRQFLYARPVFIGNLDERIITLHRIAQFPILTRLYKPGCRGRCRRSAPCKPGIDTLKSNVDVAVTLGSAVGGKVIVGGSKVGGGRKVGDGVSVARRV